MTATPMVLNAMTATAESRGPPEGERVAKPTNLKHAACLR